MKGKKRALGWLHGEQAATGKCAPDEQEARMADDFGGEVHRRSGAGMVKHDGHSKLAWWDAKHTDGRSISLPIVFLDDLFDQAMARGKLAVVELEYSQARGECRWYLVPWDDFVLDAPVRLFQRPLNTEAREGAKTVSIGLYACQGLSALVAQPTNHIPAFKVWVKWAVACQRWALITRAELDALLERRAEEV